jgi:hypothetical protein
MPHGEADREIEVTPREKTPKIVPSLYVVLDDGETYSGIDGATVLYAYWKDDANDATDFEPLKTFRLDDPKSLHLLANLMEDNES